MLRGPRDAMLALARSRTATDRSSNRPRTRAARRLRSPRRARAHCPSTSRRSSSSASAFRSHRAVARRRPAEAAAAAEELGTPVVVKADGPAHKARGGGVVLGIADARGRCGRGRRVWAARCSSPVRPERRRRGALRDDARPRLRPDPRRRPRRRRGRRARRRRPLERAPRRRRGSAHSSPRPVSRTRTASSRTLWSRWATSLSRTRASRRSRSIP